MKNLMAILLAVLIMMLPLGALAEGAATTATATNVDAGAQLMDSLKNAWNVFSGAFGSAYKKVRDDSGLQQTLSTVGEQLKRAGMEVGNYLGDVYSSLKEKANASGVSISEWLDANTAQIGEIASKAGNGIGVALDSAGDAIGKASEAVSGFIGALFGGN